MSKTTNQATSKFTFYERHRKDDIIDHITFDTVPRYKTSGLSGDEWRVSTVVKLWRKGNVMYSRSYHNVEQAAAHLPWLLRTWMETVSEEADSFENTSKPWTDQIKLDETRCHQPGCPDKADVIYRIKTRYSREGYAEAPEHSEKFEHLRAFCSRHSKRGDCGLEDNDKNYEIVSGKPQEPRPMDESPSVLGGIINVKNPYGGKS